MSELVKRVRAWFTSIISIESLLREQKLLLFAMLFYFCANSVSSVFLNLFIYQTTVNSSGLLSVDALTNVILYNIYTYVILIAMTCFTGMFAKRIPTKGSMLAGLSMHILLFVFVLLTDTNAHKYLWLFAALNGIGSALYNVAYNEILGYAFDERSKRLFIFIVGVCMTLAGILTPIVAGSFIQVGRNMNGYIAAFGTALVMLALSVAFVLCVRLQKKKKIQRAYFANVLVSIFKDTNLRFVHLAELVRGIREGVIAFLLPVLIYTLCENAVAVGIYVALCAVLQMLGEWHVMHTGNENNRMGLMLFAVAVMILTTAVFLFGFSVMSIYAYGVLTALIAGFLYVPIVGIYHWATNRITNSAKKTLEIQSARELFVTVGKVIGALAALLLHKSNALVAVIFVINLILILTWVLFSRVGEEEEQNVLLTETKETEIENNAD